MYIALTKWTFYTYDTNSVQNILYLRDGNYKMPQSKQQTTPEHAISNLDLSDRNNKCPPPPHTHTHKKKQKQKKNKQQNTPRHAISDLACAIL